MAKSSPKWVYIIELGYKKKRDFVYNAVLKVLDKIINVKSNLISGDKNLFDYLNKLALKKIIKEFKAEKKQSEEFFKEIKIVIA